MSDLPVTPEDLRRLARLVDQYDLSELRFEAGELRITLRVDSFVPAAPPASPGATPPAAAGEEPDWLAPPGEAEPPSVPTVRIEAPLMGVFYRSPAPGEPPFVDVGDVVEPGQAVGMIEAMKVFSEILSEHGGRVQEIPVRNGALVQPGDPLVVLERE